LMVDRPAAVTGHNGACAPSLSFARICSYDSRQPKINTIYGILIFTRNF